MKSILLLLLLYSVLSDISQSDGVLGCDTMWEYCLHLQGTSSGSHCWTD